MNLANVSVDGLMGMATFTNDKQQIRSEFKSLKNTFEKAKVNLISYLSYLWV